MKYFKDNMNIIEDYTKYFARLLQEEKDKYFTNFPHNESTVRDILSALKETGFFSDMKKFVPNLNPYTIELDKILAPPSPKLGEIPITKRAEGIYIISLTEGPGTHHYESSESSKEFYNEIFGDKIINYRDPYDCSKTWKVPENEVFATIDDSTLYLSGKIATHRFQKAELGLKHIESILNRLT